VGKLVVFGVLIAAGLAVIVQRGPAEALAPLDPFFEMGAVGVVAAMGFTFITFQGFELIAGVAGEVKRPRHTCPGPCSPAWGSPWPSTSPSSWW
jgi:basic amino acid/polyamine antiporter, APA family